MIHGTQYSIHKYLALPCLNLWQTCKISCDIGNSRVPNTQFTLYMCACRSLGYTGANIDVNIKPMHSVFALWARNSRVSESRTTSDPSAIWIKVGIARQRSKLLTIRLVYQFHFRHNWMKQWGLCDEHYMYGLLICYDKEDDITRVIWLYFVAVWSVEWGINVATTHQTANLFLLN